MNLSQIRIVLHSPQTVHFHFSICTLRKKIGGQMIQISGGKSALWWEQKRQMSGGKCDKLGGGKSDKGKWYIAKRFSYSGISKLKRWLWKWWPGDWITENQDTCLTWMSCSLKPDKWNRFLELTLVWWLHQSEQFKVNSRDLSGGSSHCSTSWTFSEQRARQTHVRT